MKASNKTFAKNAKSAGQISSVFKDFVGGSALSGHYSSSGRMNGELETEEFAKANNMTVQQYVRQGWLVLIAMLFAGIVAVMNQFQVPVFMNVLIDEFFPTSPGDAGWLMSVIAIAAIVAAAPSAYLLNRFGAKKIGVFGLACMALGATVGALSQTAEVLIVGRVFQGAGVAVMGIVATTVVSMYFPRAKAGRPMGIWNLWYVTGAALAYVIAVPVATWLGGSAEAWHAWWWFCAVCAYMALVVFAVFVKVPKVPKVTQRHSDLSKQNPKRAFGVVVEGFKEPRMWLLGLTFGFLMFTSLCVLSWVPTYVQDIETAKFIKEGMSAALAGEVAGADSGYLAALGFAASIPMSFITAYLLGKFTTIRARKIMLVVASALGYLYAFAFLIEFEWLPAWLVLLGIESGWTSGVVWSLVPMTMKSSRTIPTGFACIIAFQGLSNLLATPVVGYVIGSADVWTNVAPLCAASATIGVACCLVYALTGRPSSDKKQTSQKGFGLTFPVKNYRGKTAS